MQSLRILSETPTQLMVAQNSSLGWGQIIGLLFPWVLCGAVFWFLWSMKATWRYPRGKAMAIIIPSFILFCLIFNFAGGARLFIKHTLTLSRYSGQAVSEERWFGKFSDRTVYDLNAIQYAQLEFARSGTRRIVLVMKDDTVVVPLRSVYSDEDGYYAVVNAINRFLGVQRNPASSSAPQP